MTGKTLDEIVKARVGGAGGALTGDERELVTAIRDAVARALVSDNYAMVASVEALRDPTRLIAKGVVANAPVLIIIEPQRLHEK